MAKRWQCANIVMEKWLGKHFRTYDTPHEFRIADSDHFRRSKNKEYLH